MLLRIRQSHVQMARRDHWRGDIPPMRPNMDRPSFLLDWVEHEAAEMGVKFVPKNVGGSSQAVGNVVFLGTNDRKRDKLMKAAHRAHELVHIRHQRDMGLAKWLAKYGRDPRWRWAAEMVATREQVRWLKRGGATPAQLRKYVESKADKTRKTWNLWRVKGSDVHAYTRLVLLEVA